MKKLPLILTSFSYILLSTKPALAAVDIGKITPPSGAPAVGADPTSYIAGFIRNGIWLLVIGAFVIALIWMIFAGYGLIFAGDDPKKISSSWTKIYWGMIGLVIVMSSFAIIRLVEVFFGFDILSGGLQIPQLTN